MWSVRRLFNRLTARLLTRYPNLAEGFLRRHRLLESEGIPWTPLARPLSECTMALVSTAGVHLKGQTPFDMSDPDGDPSFREIRSDTPPEGLMITHDYYDHRDADRDINIVFPITRLQELEEERVIGSVAPAHYSFMGHIQGRHLRTLRDKTAPEVATRLAAQGIDCVLLTPG